MRIFLLILFTLTTMACSYTPPPTDFAKDSSVAGTGNLKYSLDTIANNKYLLSITAAPGLMETESSIAQRIHIFSNKMAAKTCPNEFKFLNDPNLDQKLAAGFWKRTKTYVFKCE